MGARRIRTVLGALVALALIAAACGGGDGSADNDAGPGDGVSDDGAGEVVTDETDTTATEPDQTDTDGTGTTGVEDEASGDATDGPRRGGSLTFLLEAESDTWDIPRAQCAVSCVTVMRTVLDSLTVINDEGEFEPYLLETYESNEDFTVHTLTLRQGITFHDGTSVDGAAMHRSLTEMAGGTLLGQILRDLENGAESIVLVDDMTVEVTFARPVSTFGWILATPVGWLVAPSFWDDPDRRSALMVGTGPFEMTEWSRGASTVVRANRNYWRTDTAGRALPYLDEIVFRPIPDPSARRATLAAGDADATQDATAENTAFWSNDWEGELVTPSPDRDLWYLLMNLSAAPFDDPQFRRALAHCTDRAEYMAFRAPEATLANGPFAEGSLGHLPDAAFPEFDPEAGNALLDEIGRPEVVSYSTTNTATNLLTAELFADMWSTNCGLNVDIDQFDQAELVTRALTGNFGVMQWRNHGRGHPGLEIHTWHSRQAQGLAINVGRLTDDRIDQLLFDSMATADRAEVNAIGQEITSVFAENVYTIWLNTNEWSVPVRSGVGGVGVLALPSGSLAQPSTLGATWLTEAWIQE